MKDSNEPGIISEVSEERRLIDSDGEDNVDNKSVESVGDSYHTAKIAFFLLGLSILLPWYVYVTPIDYWMYKFRNISATDSIGPTQNKTILQTYFLSYATIALNVPALAIAFLMIIIGHRIPRCIQGTASFCVFVIVFACQTALIDVDTDEYQNGFAIIILSTLVLSSTCTSFLQVYMLNTVSLFPKIYMEVFIAGQSIAGIFITAIQILSLIFDLTPVQNGLCYFISGFIAVLISFIYFFLLKKSAIYHHYMRVVKPEPIIDLHHLSQLKIIVKQLSPVIICLIGNFTASIACIPISVLILPKEVNKSLWTGRLFIPVCNYVIFNISDIVGRLICKFLNLTGKHLKSLLFITLIHCGIVPFLLLCNLHPRSHLPVLFPSEVYFIIIILFLGVTNGYIIMYSMSIAPLLVSPQLREKIGYVLNITIGLGLSFGSFLSPFLIRLL